VKLQQQWDIWLCATFAKRPSMKMSQSIHWFATKMEMSIDDIHAACLKRFPSGYQANHSSTSRFVCGYIKGASDFMFDSGNAIQMSVKMALCESSETPVDQIKCVSESRDKSAAKKAFKRGNDEYALGNKQREAYGRRNWSACK